MKKLDKNIISMAVPVVFGMMSQTLIQASDTVMVGSLGEVSIAAAGVGGMTYFTVLVFIMNASIGVQTFTSRRYGAGDYHELGAIASTSLAFGTLFGLLISVLGYFLSTWIVSLLIERQEVLTQASEYMQMRFLGTIPYVLIFLLRAYFDGLGLTFVGMISAITAMLFNIFFNWIFIFGNMGVPAMGVKGAGIASSLAGIPALLAFIIFFFRKDIMGYIKLSGFIFDSAFLKTASTLGFPSAVDGVMTHSSFLIFTKIAGLISVTSVAGVNIVLTIMMISFMPGIAFGISGTTLFGQAAGAKKWKRAEISIYRSANFALLIMGTMGLLFILLSKQIISLFTDSAAVILDTVPCLFVMGLAQGADAYHMTFGAALRSAGMVNWVLVVYLIASYIVMLPIAWILGIYFSLGSIGLWISVAVWLYFLGIVFFLKFRKKEWKGVSF